MTHEETIGRLAGSPRGHFAEQAAAWVQRILADGELAVLYEVAVARHDDLSAALRHTVAARGAYLLEACYFASRGDFRPFAERFCAQDFAACTDASARRSFGKIMADLLLRYDPGVDRLDAIAECAASWAVDPKSRAAVKIGAMEILKGCRGRVAWVEESWEDLLAAMARDRQPSIVCRMRNSWSPVRPETNGRRKS